MSDDLFGRLPPQRRVPVDPPERAPRGVPGDPHRLRKIGTLASVAEADAFRDELRRQGLRMTGEEMAAFAARRRRLIDTEGRR